MSVKTMKADGYTLPLPLEVAELKSHAEAAQSGFVFRCRRLIEEKDWDDIAIKLERPIDIFCWVMVTAAALVIIPLCIKLLVG
jgi:hypothetical protein